MGAPRRPLLTWDGDCHFCRLWVERWQLLTGDAVAYAPYQQVAADFTDIPVERFRAAVHLIEEDGSVTRGAEAVFRALAHAPGDGAWLRLYRHVPGFAAASEWSYRFVARHRSVLGRLTTLLWGRSVVPRGDALTSWIFLRLLGIVFLTAFLSLATQVIGLAGARGILPTADYLHAVRQQLGPGGVLFAPTLLWLNAGDGALQAWCGVGIVLSIALTLGLAAGPCLVALWAIYLSLAVACQDFLWFQWDGLLLEVAILAALLAPWRLVSRPGSDPPPRAALRVTRWLLFRLMFASAVVKLSSGDPSWRHLTALRYHYETQPLPTWSAWFMHQLPAWWQTLSTAVMFAIEGLAPFLIFAPRRLRLLAAAAIASLQLLILATGNYAFFNLLALTLCVALLDDGVWPQRWRAGFASARGRPRVLPRWVVVPAAVTLFVLSLYPMARAFHDSAEWLGPVRDLYRITAPWRVVNPYGLFQVMTTHRPEIEIEGSDDGQTWKAYAFRWKPGALERRPEFVAPHQPRLDWQMWFAALSDFRQEPWFLSFCQRLLEGSPPVIALMGRDPFPRAPPRFLRATMYEYHFTDAATRHATGAWWRRERLGLYCPVLTLEAGQLAPVPSLSQ